MQLSIITNAVNMGWKVTRINENKIMLSKNKNKLTDLDKNFENFLKAIFSTHLKNKCNTKVISDQIV
jgi:hypothetical protein